MRLKCHLFGCRESRACGQDYVCGRCSTHMYYCGGRWVEVGWLPALMWRFTIVCVWLTWPVYWLLGQRCLVCRNRLWPWSAKVHDEFCTEKCFGEWIPF